MSRAGKISDEAAQWLVRLEAQTAPGLWDDLQAWLDADARHRAAFVRLRVAWHRVDALKNMRPLDGTIDSDLLARTALLPGSVSVNGLLPARGRARSRYGAPALRRWVALACAAVVAGVLALLLGRPSWKSYETGVGGRDEIVLQDGTRVELNTNTELRARLTKSRRDIALLRGEALFQVAHDSKSPFCVTAGHTLVRAVGTEFSVRIRDASHVDVLVAEGRVALDTSGPTSTLTAAQVPASATGVSADEAAETGGDAISVKHLQPGDLTRRLAWTNGHLSFQGETLEQAAQEFNRYNRLQITIADPAIERLQVGGIFLARDPASFVAAVQRSFAIEAARSRDDIRLFAARDPAR